MSISEKYIFLSKIQLTLNTANDVLKNIDDETKRTEQEQRERENKGDEDEECPVCYESLSNLSKVVPVCGHIICLGCYSHLLTRRCVQCRHEYK